MTVTATSNRWKRRQRGFTLIEALVVLVLLGIVAIITFMGLRNVKEKTGLDFKTTAGDESWLPVEEFLDKPVKPDVLLEKVQSLLQKP